MMVQVGSDGSGRKANSSFCSWKMELFEKTGGWGHVPGGIDTEVLYHKADFHRTLTHV